MRIGRLWTFVVVLLAMGLVVAQENTASTSQPQIPTGSVALHDHDIQLGTPVHAVDPVVPKSLYGKDATAVVGATIQTDGSFTDLWALGGVQDFEDAALDALHQWRYTPATQKGILWRRRFSSPSF